MPLVQHVDHSGCPLVAWDERASDNARIWCWTIGGRHALYRSLPYATPLSSPNICRRRYSPAMCRVLLLLSSARDDAGNSTCASTPPSPPGLYPNVNLLSLPDHQCLACHLSILPSNHNTLPLGPAAHPPVLPSMPARSSHHNRLAHTTRNIPLTLLKLPTNGGFYAWRHAY